MLEVPLILITSIEAVAVSLLAYVVFRKLRPYPQCFAFATREIAETARYGDTVTVGGLTAMPAPLQSEVANVVKFGLSQLPQSFKLPHELLVEIVPHELLNERVREARVAAVLFGFSTDKGQRIVLSDVILQLPPAERNRHILHEVWHIGQLASDYHPGLQQSEYDAWVFAERHKDLA